MQVHTHTYHVRLESKAFPTPPNGYLHRNYTNGKKQVIASLSRWSQLRAH